jgi:hypothetical protein
LITQRICLRKNSISVAAGISGLPLQPRRPAPASLDVRLENGVVSRVLDPDFAFQTWVFGSSDG